MRAPGCALAAADDGAVLDEWRVNGLRRTMQERTLCAMF
jgi:hypothetical protein